MLILQKILAGAGGFFIFAVGFIKNSRTKTSAYLLLLLAGIVVTVAVIFGFRSAPDPLPRSPRANYLQYCASCHGDNHERFAARAWVYGNSLKEVSATLKHGRPAIGMPEFAKAMNDTEIRELAEYTIREVARVPDVLPASFNVNEVVRSHDLNFVLEEVAGGMIRVIIIQPCREISRSVCDYDGNKKVS